MPLAPLPPENTRRMFLITTVGSVLHSTMIRVSDTIAPGDLVSSIHFDFDILKSQMFSNVNIVGIEMAEKGSNVRNPLSGWATITGTGLGNAEGQDLARSFSMRGRSSNGRKVKMLLWGLNLQEQPDFEILPPVGDLATFVGLVQASPNKYWSIDGLHPTWYSNLLEDYNDHWIRELRP